MDNEIETPMKSGCSMDLYKTRDDETQREEEAVLREIERGAERTAERYIEKRRRLMKQSEDLTRADASSRCYVVTYRKDDPSFDTCFKAGTQHPTFLSHKYYSRLQKDPTCWLNDEVVTIIALHVTLWNHHTLALLYMFEGTKLKQTSRPSKYFNSLLRVNSPIRIMLVPLHCHGNHWTLFVVDKWFREIHFYDSLSGSNKTAAAGMEESSVLKECLPAWESLLREVDGSNQWTIREDSCPHEGNGFDCGVYVCYLMAEIARVSGSDAPKQSLRGLFQHQSRIDSVSFRASLVRTLDLYFTEDTITDTPASAEHLRERSRSE